MLPHSAGRVIVGVDGSPGSLHALRYGVDLARLFGSPLLPVLAWVPPGGDAQARCEPFTALVHEWETTAEKRLFAAFDEGLGALPADVHCEPQTVRGATGKALVWLADRPDDILVVGTGRRGQFDRLMHSHVAKYCIAHAVCTVVAVPPPPLAAVSQHLRHLTV